MAQRRPATEKAKATRARSWAKNQEAKKERIAENEKRAAHNRQVGSTGKQRANAAAKARKGKTPLSDPENVVLVEQEDLLEQ